MQLLYLQVCTVIPTHPHTCTPTHMHTPHPHSVPPHLPVQGVEKLRNGSQEGRWKAQLAAQETASLLDRRIHHLQHPKDGLWRFRLGTFRLGQPRTPQARHVRTPKAWRVRSVWVLEQVRVLCHDSLIVTRAS